MLNQELPTLYSKARNGDIRSWRVSAQGDQVVIESGKLGGKQTVHKDRVHRTNLGRSNERTAEMQAEFEAVAAWDKKKEEGYFETINDAQIHTVYLPMLAHPIMKTVTRGGVKSKVMRHVDYPADAQCKFNGLRCLAKVTALGVEFTSREGIHWYTLDHIAADIRKIGNIGDIFDGEIYQHGIPLQDIGSYVHRKQPQTAFLQMYIYDMPQSGGTTGGSWEERREELLRRFAANADKGLQWIVRVPCYEVNDYQEVQALGAKALAEGFEGLILRQRAMPYEWNNRCESLLKWKQFQDAEFEVIGGSGREYFPPGSTESMMILDKFVCRNNTNDSTFEVVPRGTMEQRRAWLGELESLKGQFLTVRFLERSKDGIPQGNPVGIAFRLAGDLPAEGKIWD